MVRVRVVLCNHVAPSFKVIADGISTRSLNANCLPLLVVGCACTCLQVHHVDPTGIAGPRSVTRHSSVASVSPIVAPVPRRTPIRAHPAPGRTLVPAAVAVKEELNVSTSSATAFRTDTANHTHALSCMTVLPLSPPFDDLGVNDPPNSAAAAASQRVEHARVRATVHTASSRLLAEDSARHPSSSARFHIRRRRILLPLTRIFGSTGT